MAHENERHGESAAFGATVTEDMFQERTDRDGRAAARQTRYHKYSRTGLANLFEGACKLSANFEKKKFLSHAHGNFEKQNKVSEHSIIIINYYIIFISVYCN